MKNTSPKKEIPGLGVIYGRTGWNRYIVNARGDVLFHKRAGRTLGETEKAKEAGFETN